MAHRLTSFTADAMRGFVNDLASDFRARTDLVDRNRDDVAAMLKASAKDRRDGENQRNRQARRTNEARRRFVNRLKSGVSSMMGEFHNLRMELASELMAASNVWKNRSFRDGSAASSGAGEFKPGQPYQKSGKKGRS